MMRRGVAPDRTSAIMAHCPGITGSQSEKKGGKKNIRVDWITGIILDEASKNKEIYFQPGISCRLLRSINNPHNIVTINKTSCFVGWV